MEEEYIEEEPWHKGPIRIIIAVFLLLLVILMVVPYYAIKLDPEPKYVPEIEDVVNIQGFVARPDISINSKEDYAFIIAWRRLLCLNKPTHSINSLHTSLINRILLSRAPSWPLMIEGC